MTGIILAGGAGLRMGGKDKALLFCSGETFLECKIRLLSSFCETVLTVAAPGIDYKTPSGVRVVWDESSGIGPLMGLYVGLKQSGTDANFVTTVDSPYLSLLLARYLGKHSAGLDAFVPLWNGFVEPLLGVYRKTCLPALQRVLREKQRRIVSFYPYINIGFAREEEVRKMDPQGLSFINVNTAEEYRSFLDAYCGPFDVNS